MNFKEKTKKNRLLVSNSLLKAIAELKGLQAHKAPVWGQRLVGQWPLYLHGCCCLPASPHCLKQLTAPPVKIPVPMPPCMLGPDSPEVGEDGSGAEEKEMPGNLSGIVLTGCMLGQSCPPQPPSCALVSEDHGGMEVPHGDRAHGQCPEAEEPALPLPLLPTDWLWLYALFRH